MAASSAAMEKFKVTPKQATIPQTKPPMSLLSLPNELRQRILLLTYGPCKLREWSLNREDKNIEKWAKQMGKVKEIAEDVEYVGKMMRRSFYRIWLANPELQNDYFRGKEWDHENLVDLIEWELEKLSV